MAAVLAVNQQQARSILSEKGVFPEIVLLKIFSNLSVHDLGIACLVCKQWNSVISGSNVVWKRFVPKWPWFEPPPESQGAYQIVKKLWKKKCVRIGNERWLPNPMPELAKYEKKLRKAEYHNYYCSCSSMTLIARLNPCYEFTTKGKDSDDEKMNEICEEIWKEFGQKDDCAFKFMSHYDVMREAKFDSRNEAMTVILKILEPDWFLEALELEPYTLDEDGEILGGGGENQGEGDVPEGDEDDIGEEIGVSRFESIFGSYGDSTAWKARINKRLPVELYRKIKAFFADGSDRFIEYYLSDGCLLDNCQYAYSLLISDTAVVHVKFYCDDE